MTSLRETYQVDVPEGQSGSWRVERYVVSEEMAKFDAMRGMFHDGRCTPAGTYTKLMNNQALVMSDTPDEIHDHLRFIHRARGHVLIAGLGLGMVLQAVAQKPEVKSVTVVELSPDVIQLIEPHYRAKSWADKFQIVNDDIYTWKMPPGDHYDCAWFDIWNNLSTDQLKDMAKLHRRYARRCDSYASWGHEMLKRRRDRERRASQAWR